MEVDKVKLKKMIAMVVMGIFMVSTLTGCGESGNKTTKKNGVITDGDEVNVFNWSEYIPDTVIKQLELLDEDVIICRITGDPVKEDIVEPKWLVKKFIVLNNIDKEMVKRDTYQGKYAKKEGRNLD